jgi:hypothetical protein
MSTLPAVAVPATALALVVRGAFILPWRTPGLVPKRFARLAAALAVATTVNFAVALVVFL